MDGFDKWIGVVPSFDFKSFPELGLSQNGSFSYWVYQAGSATIPEVDTVSILDGISQVL